VKSTNDGNPRYAAFSSLLLFTST